ncbi:hypothetical protein IFR05_016789 [Cadophora sp. M221]|nr:hypothetical protein IFR05_016789 [Cadophora sp. M221]
MNDSMFDCLAFYVVEEFLYVLKITEALHGVVRNLVDNVPLPPWEEFQALLEKVEGLKLTNDSRTSKTDDFSTESWIDEAKNTKTSSCLGITSHDLRTLLPGHCLSDVVVNSTLELLAGQTPRAPQPARVAANFTQAEVSTFDDALRIYGKKVNVNNYNHTKIKALNVPVKQIKAHHTNEAAEKADWETSGNLHKTRIIGASGLL